MRTVYGPGTTATPTRGPRYASFAAPSQRTGPSSRRSQFTRLMPAKFVTAGTSRSSTRIVPLCRTTCPLVSRITISGAFAAGFAW